jgi:hypothetical protein
VGRGFSITTFTHGHAKRSVVPRLGASRRPPTPEAVDRDAAWTPRTRPPLLGKRADAFPTLPTAVHRLGKSKKRDPRLRAGRNQTILMAPTAWPLFRRSSVAAFERSVTVGTPQGRPRATIDVRGVRGRWRRTRAVHRIGELRRSRLYPAHGQAELSGAILRTRGGVRGGRFDVT